MQTDKSKIKGSREDLTLPPGVTWEEVIEALRGEKGHHLLKTVAPTTFRFILNEKNRTAVIQVIIKTLDKSDSQDANQKYAEMTYEAMRKVIKTLAKQKKPPIDSKK